MIVHLPDLHDHSEIGHGKSGEGEESGQADGQESSGPESCSPKTCCCGGAHPDSPETLVNIPPANTFNQNLASASEATMLQIFGVPGAKTQDCSPATGAFKQRIVSLVNVGPFKVSGLDIAVKLLKAVFDEAEQQIPNVVAAVKNDGMLCVRHKRMNRQLLLESQLGHGDRPVFRHGRGSSRLAQDSPRMPAAGAVLQQARLVLGRGVLRQLRRQHALRAGGTDHQESAADKLNSVVEDRRWHSGRRRHRSANSMECHSISPWILRPTRERSSPIRIGSRETRIPASARRCSNFPITTQARARYSGVRRWRSTPMVRRPVPAVSTARRSIRPAGRTTPACTLPTARACRRRSSPTSCCRSSNPAATGHSIPRSPSAIWPSSFSRTRRRRRSAAISVHSTRSARPRSGSMKRCSSRDVPTLVRSAMTRASVCGPAIRASSKTCCILFFQIRHSPRAS